MSFKILSVTDEKNSCDCCGKSDLKSVVVIQNEETGNIGYFGCVCATNPSKAFGITKSDIAKKVRVQKKEKEEEKKKEEFEKVLQKRREENNLRIRIDTAYEATGETFNKMTGKPQNQKVWNTIKENIAA